ncbi:MAG: DUF167 family protein [Patescibacteria group bacterium]
MYIKVKATPGVKKELITKVSEDTFRVSVKEKAERNMANGRIREVLAEYFALPLSKIRLVSGHRSPSKIFDILK